MSMVGSAIVAFAGAGFPPKLICLKNQLPGRGFESGTTFGVLEPLDVDVAPSRLGGDGPRLGVGDGIGVGFRDLR